MIPLITLLLIPGEIEIIDSKDFPKEAQVRAVTATVRIVNSTKSADGTGVLLKKTGPFVYILTANHVVAGGKRFEVSTYTAQSHPNVASVCRTAEVIAQSEAADLAVLRLATKDDMPGWVTLCPRSKMPEGKDFAALSVGCSRGREPTCAIVDIKGKRRVRRPGAENTVLSWEMDSAGVPGRSGGPLLDRRGQLIGVASGTGDGKAYFTHIEEIHTFLKRNALDFLSEDKPTK